MRGRELVFFLVVCVRVILIRYRYCDIRDCYIGIVGRMASEEKESGKEPMEARKRGLTIQPLWIGRLDHVDLKVSAFGGTVYVEQLRETHLVRIQTYWSDWSNI